MHMLYNSDSYAVVQIDVPSSAGSSAGDSSVRGGYEIVDKFARKETFIQGAMAQSFQEGVQALIENDPSEEGMDAYLERFSSLMLQPVVMH